MDDILYNKFQPATWRVGVVDAPASRVAEAIAFTDPRSAKVAPTPQALTSIDDALASLEPLGSPGKLIVIATMDGRASLFSNDVATSVTEYATWCASEACEARAYFVLRVPNTIAPDQQSGAWGARQLTIRNPETPFGQEPEFHISVINDCGRWMLDRYGSPRPFEEQEAYKVRRVKDRFTEEMLLRYCDAVGLAVYDSKWYTDEVYTVAMESMKGDRGMTYHEAAAQFRISV